VQVEDIQSIIIYKVIFLESVLSLSLLLLQQLVAHVALPVLLVQDVVEGLLLGGALCHGWWLLMLSDRETIVIEDLLGVGGNIAPSLDLVVVLLHLDGLGKHHVPHELAVHHQCLIYLILSHLLLQLLRQVKIPQHLIILLLIFLHLRKVLVMGVIRKRRDLGIP
jgi:hypothetical protein